MVPLAKIPCMWMLLRKSSAMLATTYTTTTILTPCYVSTMIKILHWDSLEVCRTKTSLVMFHKMFNNLASSHPICTLYILNQFQTQPQDNVINTKSYHYHASSKNVFKFSFFPQTIPIWNNLPEELVNCNSVTFFNTKLDSYFKL